MRARLSCAHDGCDPRTDSAPRPKPRPEPLAGARTPRTGAGLGCGLGIQHADQATQQPLWGEDGGVVTPAQLETLSEWSAVTWSADAVGKWWPSSGSRRRIRYTTFITSEAVPQMDEAWPARWSEVYSLRHATTRGPATLCEDVVQPLFDREVPRWPPTCRLRCSVAGAIISAHYT
jgi:hypothetical protein